ncbi:hypothetical protein R1X32_01060 (plasmid) [Rhodococcus opacus]|uniref:hypothetical protein n=1 Tax=Rhodococcus opacus TaxID=37919 RepID=UPI0034D2BCEF
MTNFVGQAPAAPPSGVPIWVTLLISLVGALVGGGIAFASNWFLTRDQRTHDAEHKWDDRIMELVAEAIRISDDLTKKSTPADTKKEIAKSLHFIASQLEFIAPLSIRTAAHRVWAKAYEYLDEPRLATSLGVMSGLHELTEASRKYFRPWDKDPSGGKYHDQREEAEAKEKQKAEAKS